MTGKTGMTSNQSVTTKKFALSFSQQKEDLNAEQKKTAALEQCLREMESALSARILPTLPHPGGTMPPHSKSVCIFGHSTQTDITLSQKFDSMLNLPPTHNDTPAKASSSPMADVGRWSQMFSRVLPIASGYRGGRKKEEHILLTNQLGTSNTLRNQNNIFGRTTPVATNLRSYFGPPDPAHVNKHPNNDWGHWSHCQ
jgi:hypothetical protein